MVGNSMHVGTVSAVVRAALKTLKSFEMSEKLDTRNIARGCIARRADHVSVAAAEIEGIQDTGGMHQLHYQNFRLRKGSCFKKGLLDSVIKEKLTNVVLP